MRETGMHFVHKNNLCEGEKMGNFRKEAIYFMGYRKFSVIIMKSLDSSAIYLSQITLEMEQQQQQNTTRNVQFCGVYSLFCNQFYSGAINVKKIEYG